MTEDKYKGTDYTIGYETSLEIIQLLTKLTMLEFKPRDICFAGGFYRLQYRAKHLLEKIEEGE